MNVTAIPIFLRQVVKKIIDLIRLGFCKSKTVLQESQDIIL